MAEYLQTKIDKFTFRVATDRLYTPDGLWVLAEQPQGSQRVRIGVTDYLQQHNGDIAFANVKPQDTTLNAGEEFAELETMKVNIGLSCPVSGKIVEVNKKLVMTPEVINQDPYDVGWLAVIETRNWDADRSKFLDAPSYLAVMRSQAEEELQS
jgi:glycine cleavage system H protein